MSEIVALQGLRAFRKNSIDAIPEIVQPLILSSNRADALPEGGFKGMLSVYLVSTDDFKSE